MIRSVLAAVLVIAIGGTVGACGGAPMPTAGSPEVAAIQPTPIVPTEAAPTETTMPEAGTMVSDTATAEAYSGDVISATLKSFKILPAQTTYAAGHYRLKAVNTADVEHEMVLIKSDLEPEALPYDEEKDILDEDKIVGKVTEVEKVQPGTTKLSEDEFDLAPGRYILFCNIAPHFIAGMHAVITVK